MDSRHAMLATVAAALFCLNAALAEPRELDTLLKSLEHVESAEFAATHEALVMRARDGDARAQYWLGRLLHDIAPIGRRDFEAGRGWLVRSAENGHAGAAASLARIHETGYFVQVDLDEARIHYRRAMELGAAEAPHDLARLEFAREQRDDAEIMRLLNVAAERGHQSAMIDLGFMYASGAMGEVDGGKARYWAERGIERRDPRAMNLMARLYASGLGVTEPDPVEALKWAILARELGNTEAARLVGEIAEQLPESQHEEARERARAWRDARR